MNIRIETTYYTTASACLELPDGLSWANIEWWYVKWDTLFFKAKGEEEPRKIFLESDAMDGTDWKRPVEAQIYEVDEDYEPITYEPLAESMSLS